MFKQYNPDNDMMVIDIPNDSDNDNFALEIENQNLKQSRSQIKNDVWTSYFGTNSASGKCFICKNYIDCSVNSMHMFKCAYYISCKDGGSSLPNNFKPVCQTCHSKLNGKSLSEFMQEQELMNNQYQYQHQSQYQANNFNSHTFNYQFVNNTDDISMTY